MSISLVIPAYNESKYIRETLVSVFEAKKHFEREDNCKLEVIVVDNMSEDETCEICREFDVKLVTEERHNISIVRNKGASFASNDIICFLDADSKISENIFHQIYAHMSTGKYIGGGTKFKLDRRNLIFSLIFISSVLATHIVGLSGVLIYTTKDTFTKLGGFNEAFYAAEDIDFVIRMRNFGVLNGKKFKNIYRGYVITSSRKFKTLKAKDLFLQGGLLLHRSLREDPAKCEQWYNSKVHR